MAALLLVVQVGLVIRAQVLVVHAAREAARAAAVGEEPPEPTGLAADRTVISVGHPEGVPTPGGRVTAAVEHRAATDLPLVGPLVPDLVLRAEATMRVE